MKNDILVSFGLLLVSITSQCQSFYYDYIDGQKRVSFL